MSYDTKPVRAVMYGRSAPRVTELWQARTPFKSGGSIRGEYVAAMPHTGQLNAHYRDILSNDLARFRRLFVVYSYATPIAWQDDAGTYSFHVAQRFSVTSSRHAGALYGERAAAVEAEKERAFTEYVERMRAEYGDAVCAIALDEDGMPYDACLSWETAQSMALSDGYRIRVIADDGHMSRADIQALCDAERERYRDCFGIA